MGKTVNPVSLAPAGGAKIAPGLYLAKDQIVLDAYSISAGGFAYTPSGMLNPLYVWFEHNSGYTLSYDEATGKIQLWNPSGSHTHAVELGGGTSAAGASHTHAFTGVAEPPIYRLEEVQAVADNVCTLDFVPLYIWAIQVTAGGTTGAFRIIPAGETPLTNQVAINFTTGVMTFLNTDAVTAVKVSYIPKRSTGFLSAITVDEEITATEAKANLVARAGLIQYVWDDTDGVILDYEQPGTAPHATHFTTVDINDSGNSSLDCHAEDAGNTWKVSYIPYSQLPVGCFIDDADISLSSEAYNFVANNYMHPVIPGFGCQAIGETAGAALAAALWQGPSGTAANLVATYNPVTNALLTNQDTAMTIISMPWLIMDVNQLQPKTPTGTNAAESTHTHGPGTLVDAASATGDGVTPSEVTGSTTLTFYVLTLGTM
jgi:hypothetical protein